MRQHTKSILGAMALVTVLLLLAIALDVCPYLRGPDEWRWSYAIPSRPARHAIPASAVATYVVVALLWSARLVRGTPGTWERRAFFLFIVLAVPLIQASLYTVEDPDILEQPFYRTVSPTSGGVFSVASTINDPLDYLRRYPERMPSYPIHSRCYPPGLPLLFYGARRLLEHVPGLANAIGSRLRLYQCHNLLLMRSSNATIASALVQMMLPAVSGLTVLPIYGLGRRALGRRPALRAATLYPLIPSMNLWFARWEAFYALLAATIWLLLSIGLTESRTVHVAASGILLSIGSFLSFGNLAVLLPIGSWAVLWLATHREAWSWRRLVTAAVAFGGGAISLWVLYKAALGVGFLDVWRVSMSLHRGLGRSYGLWLGYDIYDFFLFLGIPLAVLCVVSWVSAARDISQRKKTLLPLGFGLGFVLLALSGMARGEVARLWLFLVPFGVLTAAHGLCCLRDRPLNVVLVFSLMAAQLLTFNAFLRVVNTGLYDPPDRDRTFSVPPMRYPHEARLRDRIALLGFDVDAKEIEPGDAIDLTLYWQPEAPIAHPYTVFVHLIGPDGRLVAQQDNMPVRDTLPTTCWVPGEIVRDPYEIAVDAGTSPGTYRLETGLYVWQTGERLQSDGTGTMPEGRVLLTEVSVVDR